jgi:ribosomal protein S20
MLLYRTNKYLKDRKMPIIKSAKKRVKVTRKATIRNAKTKRTLKTALKAFHAAVTGGKKATAEHGKAGVIHKNKAARKKKQLATKAKAAAGVAKKATPAKKTIAKKAAPKTAAKKPVAKKPVAKKAPAKKPVAKKK